MTDFSACADAALEWARLLAGQTGGRLTLAHSYALPMTQWGDASFVSDSMLESIRQGAEQALSSLAQSVEGCPVDTVTSYQLATRAAQDIAEERDIELIVLGTRGLSGLAHVTLGSTAERIIRFSDVPVVTVKVAD